MPSITYQDFHLQFRPADVDGNYTVQVLGVPGEPQSTFSRAEIKAIPNTTIVTLQGFDVPEAADRNVALVVDEEHLRVSLMRPSTLQAVREFGSALHRTVYKDNIYRALRDSLSKARREGERLRIRLNLTQVPELVALPWEYLYDDELGNFYAKSVHSPVVRYLARDEPTEPLAVSGPLRILVMIASPPQLPHLNVETEWVQLKEAVGTLEKDKALEVERLGGTTGTALNEHLAQMLLDKPFHVFHFIGHGAFDVETRTGKLLVSGEGGREVGLLSAEGLSEILHNHNQSLRLVVLNACEGARAVDTGLYTGVAQSLIQHSGIPAVIAMQYEISDRAAIAFSKQLYGSLAAGHPLESALAIARVAITRAAEANNNPDDVEWATPVLYLRASSGELFHPPKSSLPPPPGITPELSKHYNEVIEALKEGTLVPFLGLDVNLYGRLPIRNWQPGAQLPCSMELAAYLARHYGYPDKILDLVSISQFADVIKEGPYDLYKTLSPIFNDSYEITPLHRFLARLPKLLRGKGYPRAIAGDTSRQRFIIASATFDNQLEHAFDEAGIPHHVVSYVINREMPGKFWHMKRVGSKFIGEPEELGSSTSHAGLNDLDPVILKLPGTVEPDEARYAAVTEDHYFTYEGLSGLPKQLKNKLQNSYPLFLGSNPRSWHLRAMLYRVWEGRKSGRVGWAVHPDPQELDRKFWEAANVRKILKSDLETYVAGLNEMLEGLPPAEEER